MDGGCTCAQACASGCIAGYALARTQGWVCTGCPVLEGEPCPGACPSRCTGACWEHSDCSLSTWRVCVERAPMDVAGTHCPLELCLSCDHVPKCVFASWVCYVHWYITSRCIRCLGVYTPEVYMYIQGYACACNRFCTCTQTHRHSHKYTSTCVYMNPRVWR